MRAARSRLDALLNACPSVIQAILGLHALGLAYLLHLPEDTFASSRSYDWMARVGSEDWWAGASLAAALVAFAGLLPNRHTRQITALLSSGYIGVIAWGYYRSNPDATGWWTYMMLDVMSGWLVLHRVVRHAA